MNVLKKILARLNGFYYPQEYLCLAAETLEHPLRVYLVHQQEIKKDITDLHAFVGYCPVIFAMPAFPQINESEVIEVAFSPLRLQTNDHLPEKERTAFLRLKKIHRQNTANGTVLYYEATAGQHCFTTPFQQAAGQLYNRLYNQKPGNVFLKGNLYQQVHIAYALPRKISLITVGTNGSYNLFPTDLHGPVTPAQYVISLRHGGKACEQVQATRNLVLSDMHPSAYRQAYSLGKNHMQPMKDRSAFDFSNGSSALLGLPLPNDIVGYRELQLQDAFDAGIHKLLLFKIAGGRLFNHSETLAHVHNAYATWRYRKEGTGNYLLR